MRFAQPFGFPGEKFGAVEMDGLLVMENTGVFTVVVKCGTPERNV